MSYPINHYGGVTINVSGTGELDLRFAGYNNVKILQLGAMTMQATSGRVLTRLANFNSQKAKLRISTDEINEYMKVDGLTIWWKPVYSQYPANG